MFLSTKRSNPFHIETIFDSPMWDHDDDHFDHFFSSILRPRKYIFSQEEKLQRHLQSLKSKEDDVLHSIKTYESEVEQLKKTREQIEQEKNEISGQILKIAEEKKLKLENEKKNTTTSQSTEQKKNSQEQNKSYVFKRVHYKTNDMEIEEQYDSQNPEKCFKIVRKQGETPQIIYQSQQEKQQTIDNKESEKVEKIQNESVNIDQKYEQLCNMTGKQSEELKKLVNENKELTIGQLYDKAFENKLI